MKTKSSKSAKASKKKSAKSAKSTSTAELLPALAAAVAALKGFSPSPEDKQKQIDALYDQIDAIEKSVIADYEIGDAVDSINHILEALSP